ncbi:hypothetical protein FRC00_004875 [Tulasnella sp. 408]|nr:hypothetical protein FRC00_004875 [Tulasnella sp. 408]
MRLSPPGQESTAHILKDGDIIQLGVDYQGGTEEMYRCVKIKVEVGQGREWQGGANAFNTAALKQLRTLQAVEGPGSKGGLRKTVGDCCICLFAVSVCQSLFIAPCSHAFHYKCIRPLLELHHPGFSCPLCRTFADLEADVEVDENELKAIEAALDEAEEDANAAPVPAAQAAPAQAAGHTAEDAIVVDSDANGSPAANRTVAAVNPGTRNPFLNALQGHSSPAAPAVTNNGHSAIDEDRQVEDELEVGFDEDDEGDEHMVSADEFGGRHGDDIMDTTYSPDKRNAGLRELPDTTHNGAGPSSRSKALSIEARRNAAEAQAEREATEFANAATPLNNTFMTTNNLLNAIAGPSTSRPFSAQLEAEFEDHDHGVWTENEGRDGHEAGAAGGSSSGSNPGSGVNSPSMRNTAAVVNGTTMSSTTTGVAARGNDKKAGMSAAAAAAGAAATGLGSGGPKTRTPTHSQERPRAAATPGDVNIE